MKGLKTHHGKSTKTNQWESNEKHPWAAVLIYLEWWKGSQTQWKINGKINGESMKEENRGLDRTHLWGRLVQEALFSTTKPSMCPSETRRENHWKHQLEWRKYPSKTIGYRNMWPHNQWKPFTNFRNQWNIIGNGEIARQNHWKSEYVTAPARRCQGAVDLGRCLQNPSAWRHTPLLFTWFRPTLALFRYI